jgi:hypothetical protein
MYALGPSCLVTRLAISLGSDTPFVPISMTLRATMSQIGSLRSTRWRPRNDRLNAVFRRSSSLAFSLQSLSNRFIGIVYACVTASALDPGDSRPRPQPLLT